MMKRALFSAIAIVFLGSAASAATYVLDFDANGPGDDINLDSSSSQPVDDVGPTFTREITDNGIKWLLSTPDANGPVLFNSTCDGYGGSDGCNGDADLRPASQGENGVFGNILIQQDDRKGKATPNDDQNTDLLKLTLLSDVTLILTSLSVIDDGRYDVLTEIDGNLSSILGTATLGKNSETALIDGFTSDKIRIGDSVIVDFTRPNKSNGDSGGIDSLTFNVVPVPASLPLLVGGFGLMAFMRRRRKA